MVLLAHQLIDRAYLIIVFAFASKWYSSWAEILPDKGALGVSKHGRDISCSCSLRIKHSFVVLAW